MSSVASMLAAARAAATVLARASEQQRNATLLAAIDALGRNEDAILAASARDVAGAREANIPPAMLDRLALDPTRLKAMAASIRELLALPDPLAGTRDLGSRPNGLRISKRRLPLGVLAVVYEARPNVTVEAATLALKSGNAVVLRGGHEARHSNAALAAAMRSALETAGLPADCVQFIDDPARERVAELLASQGQVDLGIVRGGAALMAIVDQCAQVPIVRHGQGVTHLFIDASAEAGMTERLALNSKVQRPGVCNALETLLLHRDVLESGLWRALAQSLVAAGVGLRVDAEAAAVLRAAGIPFVPARDADWDTEFLSLLLAVRTVPSLAAALEHIAAHGTHHTASIVTTDVGNAERFLQEVDASCVLWNASTRFNDGGQLGLGAEMGISTSKMHAYGPMGLLELTAEKYVVIGSGQLRECDSPMIVADSQ